jgi:S1-C subfamily serine protease
MSDSGDWWAHASTPDAPDSHRPHHSHRARSSRRGPGRLLVAVVAGAAALAVALAGSASVIDHQQRPFAAGALLSGSRPAADTSAASGSPKPKPVAKASTVPAPVLPVAEVVNRVQPGVVIVNSELGYQNAEAAGTGMVLTPTGEILTNNHVVDGATLITVIIPATQRHYIARVVGTLPASDVAVLALTGASGLATIPLGNSDEVAAGQSVVAIGNAGGRGTLSVVTGSVTSTNRTITASDASGRSSERLTGMIEVEAAIRAGDSGGPLSNRAGQVIGMDTAASATQGNDSASPTFGFAIPINRALDVAAQLEDAAKAHKSGVATGRGYLGIQVRSADASTNTGGAEVVLTTPDSPASTAGLVAGDLITELNGEPVVSANGLTESLQQSRPGQSVTVEWLDQFGGTHSALVTLANGPAD